MGGKATGRRGIARTTFGLRTLALCALAWSAAAVEPDDADGAARADGPVDAAKAATLEALLARHPDDVQSRVRLIEYYGRLAVQGGNLHSHLRHGEHVLWMVRHAPRDPVLATPSAEIDAVGNPGGFEQAERAWRGQVAGDGVDAALLGNAAGFLKAVDRGLAAALLARAARLEPDKADWEFRQGLLRMSSSIEAYWTGRGAGPATPDPVAAADALVHFERAYELSRDDEPSPVYLAAAMRTAFEAGSHGLARAYALEALGNKGPFWDGQTAHWAHVVLGRIALADGDVDAAAEHLVAAGGIDTTYAAGLRSFGPNMALALELLLAGGARDAVLRYFDLCAEFWDAEQLREWRGVVEAGGLPDFGSNVFF